MDDIVTITWCKDKGVKLVKPNEELADEYINAAIDTINTLSKTESVMWKSTMTYYAEYFLLTAILTRLGVNSTLHECSLAIARLLVQGKILSKKFVSKLEEDKHYRVQNQYYLRNIEIKTTKSDLQNFVDQTKIVLRTMSEQSMYAFREKFSSL